jgi:spore germination protein YaaH
MASPLTARARPLVNAALLPSNPKLAREVFGFAPYWALSGNGNWDYSLLSTIAYFGLDVQGDGSFNTSATNNGFKGWMSQDLVNVINKAHANSDRVVLVIKAFDDGTINAIVSNPTASQNAINWTIQSIRSRNLDGVNIDFEGSASSSYPNLPSQFSAFVANLSNQVHAAIPGSVVSVDTYSGSASWDGGFMNITQLAPSVDSLFVMAYDMGFGNLPGQAAPNAPLNGWTYNDTTSVRQYIAKATAAKVILGVPYYGYKYSTAGNLPYATTTGGAVADTYSGILDDFSCALQLSRNWDATASSPWASWWSPASGDPCGGNHNSWRELYYDNATSLMAKYDLVNSSDLQGTGMWALGYDGTSPDLWQALAIKLRASWAATFDMSALPQRWAVNQMRSVTIGVTNQGNSTWPAGGSNPVHLGVHFLSAASSVLTDQRFALATDVVPGQTVSLTVSVTAPPGTNAATLQAQMVKEQQLWFKQWANVAVTMQDATWMGSYDASAIPRTWTYGQTQSFPVSVTNSGNQTWPASGPSPVRLGLHFAGGPLQPWSSWLTDQRFALPGDLAPGQTATITVSATAPPSKSASVLEAQLLKEGQFWFFQSGPMAVTAAAPAWVAGYDLSLVPHQWTPGQTQTIAVTVINTGNQVWPAGGTNPVHLGLHFAQAPGLPVTEWLSDQRANLPADLQPGQSVTLTVPITAPSGAGVAVLEAKMVKEQQFWFVPVGAASVQTSSVTWLAGYDVASVPRIWVAGQPQTIPITVRNTGNQAWPAAGSNPVHLGLHFSSGTAMLSDQRVVLPADLQPGQTATLSVTLTAPSTTDAVILEAQMVKEQQFWFVPSGTTAITNASASWIAGYDLAQAPRAWTPGQTQSFTVTVLNAGNQAWPSTGSSPVRLDVHFAASAGMPYSAWLTDQRVALPADVVAGQTVALSVTVTAPAGDTGGVLEVEAVKEGQFWFPQRAPVSFLAS